MYSSVMFLLPCALRRLILKLQPEKYIPDDCLHIHTQYPAIKQRRPRIAAGITCTRHTIAASAERPYTHVHMIGCPIE